MAEKLTVFISGTMRDLHTERARVAAAIQDMGLEPVWAEERGATDRPPRDECERMARTCHVYLGLYGLSYGWKFPPNKTTSATELEWQTAKKAGKPMLIYRQKGDPDSEQAAFLEKAGEWQKGRYWYEFETLDNLLPRLRDDLAQLIAESFRPERPADLADYRAHLRRLYADLPLSGIPVPLDVTLPLDRVYIRLRALSEREEALRQAAAPPSDLKKEMPHRLAELLWRHREEMEEATRPLEETQPIPPEEAIARHDRLAVLGEAGAGKSTLLRHLAWEWAGDPEAPLPLLVPLGRADALISQTGCSLLGATLDLLTEHKAGEERDALERALADAIGDKKVLFLCDGLDEAHLARQSVVAGLEKLAADGHRSVLTSRPLGYQRLAATDMAHFQVLPLLPEDARAFSERWFRALAEARGVPGAEQEEWAAERAGWLQRQLEERPSLQEVARNPLLLTFLAVLAGDEPQRDLPPHRKELYREYVERLFTVWEARRQQEGELSLGKLRGEEARHVVLWGLYRTAWHLHRAYYGDDEGPQAVHGEIEPLLAQDLKERWEFDALQAEALATEVLRFWEKAGLLDVYRLAGQEWLAFRHPTFQEYGAARVLAEAYQDNADGLWECFSPYLLHPQWAGVVPLTLAHLAGAQATTLVESLLEANGNVEDQQRPSLLIKRLLKADESLEHLGEAIIEFNKARQCPLLLAAAALAEGAEVTDVSHRRVVDTLLNLARTRGWWEGGQKARAKDAISALGRLTGDEYAAAGLLCLAEDEAVNDWVRVGAVEALGGLGQADDLLILAQDRTVEARVRVGAAEALGRLGRTDTLLTLSRDLTEAVEVRTRAAAALWKLGRADESAKAWLAMARDSTLEINSRIGVTSILLKLKRADESAEAWLALAQDQAVEAGVRERAVEVLGKLGHATPEILAELQVLAEEPGTPESVRRAAREALKRLEK
jgi:hypothetical protein